MGVINLGALVEKLKKKLANSGFIKNTDYASGTTGGVIKTDSTYATDITDAGKLKSKTITAANYAGANASAFISKGTLDALIEAGTFGGGGVTVDLLCAETAEDNQGKTLTPTSPISGYKEIVIVIKHGDGNTCSNFLVNALVVNDTTAKNAAPVMGTSNSVIPLKFKYTTDGKIITDGISNIWHTATLYGIK